MSNLFIKPRTMVQWLLSSACWLGSSLGGWLALVLVGSALFPQNHALHEAGQLLTIGGFVVVHWLIWQKVIFWWQPAQDDDATWLFLVSGVWLGVLILFQLFCLAWMLIGLAFALGEPMVW